MNDLSPEEIERRKAAFRNHPLCRQFYGEGVEYDVLPLEADPETSPEILAKLLFHEWEHVREIAGLNPSTPPDALAAAVMMIGLDDGHEAPLKSIAENPSCPPDVLASLARHEDWGIRQALARNESTPPETLAGLMDFNNTDFVELARNRSCPAETLAILAKHELDGVRQAVATNESCPRDTLAALAAERDEFKMRDEVLVELFGVQDKDWGEHTRLAVTKNKACPLDILSGLAADENPIVSAAAKESLAAGERAIKIDFKSSYLYELARRERPAYLDKRDREPER